VTRSASARAGDLDRDHTGAPGGWPALAARAPGTDRCGVRPVRRADGRRGASYLPGPAPGKGLQWGLACGGRPRGHLVDGKRQIARTKYEAVDADGKRPDTVCDPAWAPGVSRPGRAAGDRLGCSHQLAL